MRTYFNTTEASGQQLKKYADIAQSQDEIVLKFFAKNKHRDFTACEVFKALSQDHGFIKDSVKRSITVLTGFGDLIKGNKLEQRMGEHGRLVSTWKYNINKQNT